MVMNGVAIVLIIVLDIYILRQIDRHETAIIELLRRHPELLSEDDWDE